VRQVTLAYLITKECPVTAVLLATRAMLTEFERRGPLMQAMLHAMLHARPAPAILLT
jgi:hypothetical protein